MTKFDTLYRKIINESMDLNQLAAVSDTALDKAYHYGRSTPGNSFGWQANLKSAEFAKKIIDSGITDIEKISDAIHKGWNVTAKMFVENPDQFDDRKNETAKLQKKYPDKSSEEIAQEVDTLIEKKRVQRSSLMKQNYAQLSEDEKEKDRVVARALLQALQPKSVSEGVNKRRLNESAIPSEMFDNSYCIFVSASRANEFKKAVKEHSLDEEGVRVLTATFNDSTAVIVIPIKANFRSIEKTLHELPAAKDGFWGQMGMGYKGKSWSEV